ncbi:16S rRNA (uracil(1498)-N(3))-methyltransferase [Botrimarina hoheduenensis]|uniref:Ribosomal RNA small subunit methyltransferase E n=1 Tax=Botrimarina hoheduenensis TaxID=2528000 RepID=A0A5C5WAN0_9BACT|nr:16S rRNA (uracil(1498)-N(3))-methyltransferase [Botrimarina hoheduenensis]TWT47225.1 Ribosomal RNA small subunit methyltransferase E [Botrimarina hoheduenensis]
MSSRFYCETLIDGATATLDGPEAHHLLHVMRGKVGDRLTLFDGSGAEYEAQVTGLTRSAATLAVLAREAIDRELPFALTLGVALPKGDRQRVLVEKLTELGVTRLTPLQTERSVVDLKGGAVDKLRRMVVEASKQCGRNRLMGIDEPQRLADFLTAPATGPRLLAHPSGSVFPQRIGTDPAVIAIGPEGGFSDEEVAAARGAGWSVATFGPRILRIETAAIMAAALCAAPAHSD